jgi:class 3 adenylate cyclase
MGVIRRMNFDEPGQTRRFPHGFGQMAEVGPLAIGRGVLEPGWRWSVDIKPLAGTPSCEIHHLQVLLGGRFGVEMNDGETAEFKPGDVFEIPPGHDAWVVGDETVTLLDVFGNIGSFALPSSNERILATLLMTDIVDSTATAARLGDAAWTQALANHNRVIRTELERFRGREVNTTGDGFLATFGSAVGALRCAIAIRDAIRRLGVQVRVGVHTGEVEILPNDIGGIAVHAVARIMALGGASEVVVSATTRSLVDGSGLRFEERGRHQLKGLESPVDVFLLAG